MAARASRSATISQYGYDPGASFQPEERIGGPFVNRRRKRIRNAAMFSAIVLGGGWVWLNHHATVSEWISAIAGAISPAPAHKATDPLAFIPSPQIAAANESSSEPAVPALPPMAAAASPPAPETAVPDEQVAAPPAEKLPPPVVDPADPYQTRALAVGLHPGLSRVLLAKLSAIDYRNAGIAIKTALAETPDADVFVWPRQRTPELALFQIKFVAGAMPDCRRYVVMVTKDSWLTTALPMEKCGIRQKDARK